MTTYKIEIPEISDIESSKNIDNLETNSNSHKKQQDEKQIEPPSIAVLPFENMSQDEEQEYFVDGITEDIITNLSLWRELSLSFQEIPLSIIKMLQKHQRDQL